jgi:hypothetical protein
MGVLLVFVIIVLEIAITAGIYVIKIVRTLSQKPDFTGGEVLQEEEDDVTAWS